MAIVRGGAQGSGRLRPPTLGLMLAEARSLFEFNASLLLSPVLLRARLTEIHAASGRKVSLVGWSLGGVYARDLALQAPDMVRNVVTLGSPFANDVRATNATALYEMMSGERVEDFAELREAIAGDLPVPATSIYSRTDGVVNWRTCLF